MRKKIISAIVIPLYKQFKVLNEREILSLENSCKIMNKHRFVLIGPAELKWDEYVNFFDLYGIITKKIVFKSRFFYNVQGYNELLKSYEFYEKFKNFNYILIAQTDSYIFKDELQYWCNRQYDYIGAPWFENWSDGKSDNKFLGVGNGGFSLRNVESNARILRRAKKIMQIRKYWFLTHLQSIVKFETFIQCFKNFFKIVEIGKLKDIIEGQYLNEDYYLSHLLSGVFTDYNVAPVEEAIKFSFEVHPSLLFKMNNNNLPFGCHGWEKYEPEFWKPFIN